MRVGKNIPAICESGEPMPSDFGRNFSPDFQNPDAAQAEQITSGVLPVFGMTVLWLLFFLLFLFAD